MNGSDASSAAREINRLHGEAVKRAADSRSSLLAALEAAWHVGQLLVEEKRHIRQTMGGGAWLIWLQQNFEGTPRTAQRYMRIAQSDADVSSLRGMSLRQSYARLGIATEPKSQANRAPVEKLPSHIRCAHKLVVALKPCARLRHVTPEQCAAYRQDLRQLYDLIRPLFEPGSANLAFHAASGNHPS